MPKKSYNTILDEHLHILIAQGNHEAYVKLVGRYRNHAAKLCHELLTQYEKTGVTVADLLAVCGDCFNSVVVKYDASVSSFYAFWKKITLHRLIDYLNINSYTAEAAVFNGDISIDQEFGDNHLYAEVLCERDDERFREKMIADIKRIVKKNSGFFKEKELIILNLSLEGYSLADLEHTGVISKSNLYITFNAAVQKLKELIVTIKNK